MSGSNSIVKDRDLEVTVFVVGIIQKIVVIERERDRMDVFLYIMNIWWSFKALLTLLRIFAVL